MFGTLLALFINYGRTGSSALRFLVVFCMATLIWMVVRGEPWRSRAAVFAGENGRCETAWCSGSASLVIRGVGEPPRFLPAGLVVLVPCRGASHQVPGRAASVLPP